MSASIPHRIPNIEKIIEDSNKSFEKCQEDFKVELTLLLNKYCMDEWTDTPDFLLSEYLFVSLKAFRETKEMSKNWFDELPADK